MISNVCGGLRCRSESNLGCLCVFSSSCQLWHLALAWEWWVIICSYWSFMELEGCLWFCSKDPRQTAQVNWWSMTINIQGLVFLPCCRWIPYRNWYLVWRHELEVASDMFRSYYRYSTGFLYIFFFSMFNFHADHIFLWKTNRTGLLNIPGWWRPWEALCLGWSKITLWVESYTCLIFFGGSHAKTLMWFYDILRFLEFCTGFLWQQVDYLKEKWIELKRNFILSLFSWVPWPIMTHWNHWIPRWGTSLLSMLMDLVPWILQQAREIC